MSDFVSKHRHCYVVFFGSTLPTYSCEADDFAQQGNWVASSFIPAPTDVLVGTDEDEARSVGLTITFISVEYDLEGNA